VLLFVVFLKFGQKFETGEAKDDGLTIKILKLFCILKLESKIATNQKNGADKMMCDVREPYSSAMVNALRDHWIERADDHYYEYSSK
jgi:hypothetical protein